MSTRPASRIAILSAVLAVPVASFAGVIWDGGGAANTSWGEPTNWDSDALPPFGGSDSLTVTTGFGANTALTLGSDRSIGRITFGGGATAISLSGNTLRLNSTTTSAAVGTALWNASTSDNIAATINSAIRLQSGSAGSYTGYFRENNNSSGGTQFNGAITQGTGESWTLRFSRPNARGVFRLNNASNSIAVVRNDGADVFSLTPGSFGGASITLNGGATGTASTDHFTGTSAVSNDIGLLANSTWTSNAASRLTGPLSQSTFALTFSGSSVTVADFASVSGTGVTNVNGTVSATGMSKLTSGTLSLNSGTAGQGVFVLSGTGGNGVPTWSDFAAARTYNQSGGANTWRINGGTTGAQAGGFAARGADVTIPASGGGLTNATFARNLALGTTAILNGSRFANNAVNIQTDIAYAANTNYEIFVANNSEVTRSETNWTFGGPVHELSGVITGDNIGIIPYATTTSAGILRISNPSNSLTNTGGPSAWVLGSTRSALTTQSGRSVGGGNHKDFSNIAMIFTSDGAFGGAADVSVNAVSSSGSSAAGYLLLEDTNGAGNTTFGRNFRINASTTNGAGFGSWGGDVVYAGNGTSTGVIELTGSNGNLPLSAENGSTLSLGVRGGDAATILNNRTAGSVVYNTGGSGTVALNNVVFGGSLTSQSYRVREGTLLVNMNLPTGALTVDSGASLGGDGTINGNVTFSAGASTLSPGNSPGSLDISGSLTLVSSASLAVELGGATPGDGSGFYDQVNVGGTASLANAALNVSTFGGFNPSGGVYYILSRAGGTGTFLGLGEGDVVSIDGGLGTAQITYLADWTGSQGTSSLTGGNDVALYNVSYVPEPASLSLLAMGAIGLLRRKR